MCIRTLESADQYVCHVINSCHCCITVECFVTNTRCDNDDLHFVKLALHFKVLKVQRLSCEPDSVSQTFAEAVSCYMHGCFGLSNCASKLAHLQHHALNFAQPRNIVFARLGFEHNCLGIPLAKAKAVPTTAGF